MAFKLGERVKLKESSKYFKKEGKLGIGFIDSINRETPQPIMVKFPGGSEYPYRQGDLERAPITNWREALK